MIRDLIMDKELIEIYMNETILDDKDYDMDKTPEGILHIKNIILNSLYYNAEDGSYYWNGWNINKFVLIDGWNEAIPLFKIRRRSK